MNLLRTGEYDCVNIEVEMQFKVKNPRSEAIPSSDLDRLRMMLSTPGRQWNIGKLPPDDGSFRFGINGICLTASQYITKASISL